MNDPSAEQASSWSVGEWRTSVVKQLLRFSALTMSVAFLVFLPNQLSHGKYALAGTITIAALALIAAGWSERISHRVRSTVLAFACLGVATMAIISGKTWAPNSFVGMSMVTVVLSVTTSRRAAWWALGGSMVIIATLGVWFTMYGPFEPTDVADVTRWQNWARIAAVFAPATALGVIAVSRLVEKFEASLVANKRLLELERKVAATQLEGLAEQARRAVVNQEAQRLEALGRLAGGIAHDFNNLLLVVIANAEALSGADRKLADELLAEIKDAGHRGAELARTLLTFGRSSGGVSPVPLNTNVEGALKVLSRLLPADQRFEFVPDSKVGEVDSNTGQLGQIVMNLVINARDAMPNGGTIRVTTALEANGQACLTISDTGTGMDEATQARVFEPYFTTKAVGRGTGLGLSTVHGIVQSHGGTIALRSSPGQGTTVEVRLKVSTASSSNASAPQLVAASSKTTVLVVDDEPMSLRVLARLLRHAGYDVIACPGGKEALAEFDAHGSRIALVVSDVLMPGMNGKELHDVLSARAPQLPFLFCSGYSSDVLPDALLAMPGRALLSKPFATDALTEHVERLLLESKRG